jgi:hypothetical protein
MIPDAVGDGYADLGSDCIASRVGLKWTPIGGSGSSTDSQKWKER